MDWKMARDQIGTVTRSVVLLWLFWPGEEFWLLKTLRWFFVRFSLVWSQMTISEAYRGRRTELLWFR